MALVLVAAGIAVVLMNTGSRLETPRWPIVTPVHVDARLPYLEDLLGKDLRKRELAAQGIERTLQAFPDAKRAWLGAEEAALRAALTSTEARVRTGAARLLGCGMRRDGEVRRSLIAARGDPDPDVRAAVRQAVERLTRETSRVTPTTASSMR